MVDGRTRAADRPPAGFKTVLDRNVRVNLGHLKAGRPGALNWLARDGEDWVIRSFAGTLRIASLHRERKYRQGVAQRLEACAAAYGYGQVVRARPGDVVIDVGANIGEFALRCLRDGATVHALEADPAVYPKLQRNLERIDRAITYPVAVWRESGRQVFYSSPAGADSSFVEPKRYDATLEVDAVTLDDFCNESKIGPVSLIKCDAEGAEPEVLEGAAHVLTRTRYALFNCGPERRGETTVDAVSDVFRARGFTVRILDGYRPATVVFAINQCPPRTHEP